MLCGCCLRIIGRHVVCDRDRDRDHNTLRMVFEDHHRQKYTYILADSCVSWSSNLLHPCCDFLSQAWDWRRQDVIYDGSLFQTMCNKDCSLWSSNMIFKNVVERSAGMCVSCRTCVYNVLQYVCMPRWLGNTHIFESRLRSLCVFYQPDFTEVVEPKLSMYSLDISINQVYRDRDRDTAWFQKSSFDERESTGSPILWTFK